MSAECLPTAPSAHVCSGNNNRNYVSEGLGGTNGTEKVLSILPGGQCQIVTTVTIFVFYYLCV